MAVPVGARLLHDHNQRGCTRGGARVPGFPGGTEGTWPACPAAGCPAARVPPEESAGLRCGFAPGRSEVWPTQRGRNFEARTAIAPDTVRASVPPMHAVALGLAPPRARVGATSFDDPDRRRPDSPCGSELGRRLEPREQSEGVGLVRFDLERPAGILDGGPPVPGPRMSLGQAVERGSRVRVL